MTTPEALARSLHDRVILGEETITNTFATDFPGTHYGRVDAFDLELFKRKLVCDIKFISPLEMEFDLIGLDASIANALRRIMLAEVPTVALDRIYLHNNTTVIPDEVLSLRVGHIPIHCDARLLEQMPNDDTPATDQNAIVFKLRARCKTRPGLSKDDLKKLDRKERFVNPNMLSGMFVWHPEGDQRSHLTQSFAEVDGKGSQRVAEAFKPFWEQRKQKYLDVLKEHLNGWTEEEKAGLMDVEDSNACLVFPVHEDIVVDKMRGGQEVCMDVLAVKGIGRTHAKWSPVSVASYRLLPEIHILQPIIGEDARKFQKCFNKGVIELEEQGGQTRAVVKNPRLYSMSRECLRHPEFKDKVLLTRVRDHFIFHVESVGAYASPSDIFIQACKIMVRKAKVLSDALAEMVAQHQTEGR